MADTEEVVEAPEPESPSKFALMIPLLGGIPGMVFSAVLIAATAFMGAYFATASAELPQVAGADQDKSDGEEPGPTVKLKAFIYNCIDGSGDPHTAKVRVTLELRPGESVDEFERFVPLLRDHMLSGLRSLTYDQLRDPRSADLIDIRLLARARDIAGKRVKSILVQELVMQ